MRPWFGLATASMYAKITPTAWQHCAINICDQRMTSEFVSTRRTVHLFAQWGGWHGRPRSRVVCGKIHFLQKRCLWAFWDVWRDIQTVCGLRIDAQVALSSWYFYALFARSISQDAGRRFEQCVLQKSVEGESRRCFCMAKKWFAALFFYSFHEAIGQIGAV